MSVNRQTAVIANTWIAEHDERWLFTILYVGLAVSLSLWISLFWLLAVVVAHGVLEWLALLYKGVQRHRVGQVLWHIKLDIGLLVFALWLGVYMEMIFGIAGLGAIARTGAQASARFISWQHLIRGLLLTVDDAAQLVRAVAARREGEISKDDEPVIRSWFAPWRIGDWVGIGMIVVFAALIILAPVLTEHTPQTLFQAIAHDLHPWPR
jgi:hypothetical protein